MPMVGGKEFPYTEKGKADAKKASKMTGKSMMDGDKKKDPFYGDKGPSASRKKMTDDPKALMADVRKRALKNRLKSKGMK